MRLANTNVRYGLAGFGVVMVVIILIFALKVDIPMYAMAVLGVAAVLLLLAPVMYVKRTTATFENRYLNVNGSGIGFSIPVDNIRTFELRDKLVVGDAVKASTNGWMAGGLFKNPEFGEYHLSADVDEHAFIVVRFTGNVLVFNLKTEDETRAFYEKVKPSIPVDTRRR